MSVVDIRIGNSLGFEDSSRNADLRSLQFTQRQTFRSAGVQEVARLFKQS